MTAPAASLKTKKETTGRCTASKVLANWSGWIAKILHSPEVRRTAAVTSTVGTVLMLGITVTIATSVGLFIFNEVNEEPDRTTTRLEVISRGTSGLVISHNGGHEIALAAGQLIMVVDGVLVEEPLTNYSAQTDDGVTWKIGDTICIVGASASCTYPPGTDVSYVAVSAADKLIATHGTRLPTNAPPPPPTAPNLENQVVTIEPASPILGDTIYVNSTVVNSGNADITAAQLFNVVLRIGGVVRDTEVVNGPLTQGSTTDVFLTWASTSSGTLAVTVTVDDSGLITESDETDNVYTDSVTIAGPIADPGQPFEDVDGDRLYLAGTDILIPTAQVTDGVYDARPNGLVITPSTGTISPNSAVVFTGAGSGVTLNSNISVGGKSVKLDATAGDVRLAPFAQVHITGNQKVDVSLLAASGNILINGSTLMADGRDVILDTTGDIHIGGSTLRCDASGDEIVLDVALATNTVYLDGVFLQHQGPAAHTADLIPDNANVVGTPAQGSYA